MNDFIKGILYLIFFFILCVIVLAIGLFAIKSVRADYLPDGIEPPAITNTSTCLGTNLMVDYWEVAPEYGDEWASENIITYMNNGTLNTFDGDSSPAYGQADWLIDKYPHGVLTVEVTSNLYRNINLEYTHIETVVIPIDETCYSVGDINDIVLHDMPSNHLFRRNWKATLDNGQTLANMSIVLVEDGTWMCDEVVDVTRIGGLYIDALDDLCFQKQQEQPPMPNYSVTYIPMVMK